MLCCKGLGKVGEWVCFLRRLHEVHEGNEVVPVCYFGNYLVGLDNNWNFESILKFAAKSNFIHYRFSITWISQDAPVVFLVSQKAMYVP